MSEATHFELVSFFIFFVAIIHSFMASKIKKCSHRYRPGSFKENLLHLLGEVEIVFGFWSAILVGIGIWLNDFNSINNYLEGQKFNEAIFVFVIMSVCSTLPIIEGAERFLIVISRLIPIKKELMQFFIILGFGPLLGSLITEPAAMTICAYLLLPHYFTKNHSSKYKYAVLALLFLNISIGGTLTTFSAPPVLMVAKKWNWNQLFMLKHFVPLTLTSLLVNTLLVTIYFKKEILDHYKKDQIPSNKKVPIPIIFIHLIFLLAIVTFSHHIVFYLGFFLFFIGFHKATNEYQNELNLKNPLLVSFFLAGIVVLGGLQSWWLSKILNSLNQLELYLGAISLTGITDNAAITYLGSLVSNLTDDMKLILVKGSVVGGGLTLIANAPNPIGFGILSDSFEKDSFSHFQFILWALPFTLLTALIFYF